MMSPYLPNVAVIQKKKRKERKKKERKEKKRKTEKKKKGFCGSRIQSVIGR